MTDLATLTAGQRRLVLQGRKGPFKSTDFDHQPAIDGGNRMLRTPARVCELKALGFIWSKRMVRGSGAALVAEYTLVSEPEQVERENGTVADIASNAATVRDGTRHDAPAIGIRSLAEPTPERLEHRPSACPSLPAPNIHSGEPCSKPKSSVGSLVDMSSLSVSPGDPQEQLGLFVLPAVVTAHYRQEAA